MKLGMKIMQLRYCVVFDLIPCRVWIFHVIVQMLRQAVFLEC
jgi:hypothetical protein